MIDVYILGDVTFMGKVVAKQWFAGIFSFPDMPKAGTVITLEKALGGDTEYAGRYLVSKVDFSCESGFSDPTIKVWVTPVSVAG